MKCQSLFLEKKKKSNNMVSAEMAMSANGLNFICHYACQNNSRLPDMVITDLTVMMPF